MDTSSQSTEKDSFVNQTWGSLRKAMIGSFAVVVFGTVILLMSLVAATDPARVSPYEAGSAALVEKAEVKIDYYLPYPGMLPDNPLYRLKAVRDIISLGLTFDEGRKAEKELFYADKRINAAVFLEEGGKEALAITTATKAEKYLEQAVRRTIKLDGSGRDEKSFLGVLVNATYKHMEIVKMLQDKADGDRKTAMAETYKITEMVNKEARQALLEAK